MTTQNDLKKGRTFVLKLGAILIGYGLFDTWFFSWAVPSLIDQHDTTLLVGLIVAVAIVLIVNAWAVTTIWGMFLPKTPKD